MWESIRHLISARVSPAFVLSVIPNAVRNPYLLMPLSTAFRAGDEDG